MKLSYEKPTIEFEEYELNTAIATGCSTVVNIGLGASASTHGHSHTACSDYVADLGGMDMMSLFSNNDAACDVNWLPGMHGLAPRTMNFWDKICECYLSSGGSTVFTS